MTTAFELSLIIARQIGWSVSILQNVINWKGKKNGPFPNLFPEKNACLICILGSPLEQVQM